MRPSGGTALAQVRFAYLSRDGQLILAWTDAGSANIDGRWCNGWICARRRRAGIDQFVGVCTMSDPAVASRGELLRRSRRSVHPDVHVHQYLAAGLPDGGMAEHRNRGRPASSSTGSHAARRAGAAKGAPICDRAASCSRSGLVRRVRRRLGFSAEPLVPASDRGSRHASRRRRSAARRRHDPELPQRVRDRPVDRRPNGPPVVVFRLASIGAHVAER